MRGRSVRSVALMAACLAVIGCDALPKPQPTGTAAQATTVTTAICAARIAAADLAAEATIMAVDSCRFTLEGRDASRAALESGAAGAALWAAIWVYASSGEDASPLRPVLGVADPSARVLAAAALISFGDATGFETLSAAVGSTETVAGSEPPVSIGAFATGALERFVAGAGLPATAPEWPTWLEVNRARLVFDAAAGTWSVP